MCTKCARDYANTTSFTEQRNHVSPAHSDQAQPFSTTNTRSICSDSYRGRQVNALEFSELDVEPR
jgi:hypothetical protein